MNVKPIPINNSGIVFKVAVWRMGGVVEGVKVDGGVKIEGVEEFGLSGNYWKMADDP